MANLWLQWFNYNNVFLLLFVVKLWLIFIRVVSSSLLLFLYLLRDEDSEVTGVYGLLSATCYIIHNQESQNKHYFWC